MIKILFSVLLGVLVFFVGCIMMNLCFFLFDYTEERYPELSAHFDKMLDKIFKRSESND